MKVHQVSNLHGGQTAYTSQKDKDVQEQALATCRAGKFGIYSKALLKRGLSGEINLRDSKGMFSLHRLLPLWRGLFQQQLCLLSDFTS